MSVPTVRISSGMIEALAKKTNGEKFIKAVNEVSVVDGYVHVMPLKDWQDIQVDFGLMKSRGVGDTVAKFTKAIGIKPCGGCKKRREKFNQAVPYKPEEDVPQSQK